MYVDKGRTRVGTLEWVSAALRNMEPEYGSKPVCQTLARLLPADGEVYAPEAERAEKGLGSKEAVDAAVLGPEGPGEHQLHAAKRHLSAAFQVVYVYTHGRSLYGYKGEG